MNGRPLRCFKDEKTQKKTFVMRYTIQDLGQIAPQDDVTHGDLSTNNILIDEHCNAFLIDLLICLDEVRGSIDRMSWMKY